MKFIIYAFLVHSILLKNAHLGVGQFIELDGLYFILFNNQELSGIEARRVCSDDYGSLIFLQHSMSAHLLEFYRQFAQGSLVWTAFGCRANGACSDSLVTRTVGSDDWDTGYPVNSTEITTILWAKNSGKLRNRIGTDSSDIADVLCYYNQLCESRSVQCYNTGACFGSACVCNDGYTGARCADLLCRPNPCANGGSCSWDVQTVICSCAEGYSGEFCENEVPTTTGKLN